MEAAVELEGRAVRLARAAQRHVLPVGPVGGRAACDRHLDRHVGIHVEIGVVVLELVVVPRDEPRVRRVRRLQMDVGLVLAVPDPVVVEREDLAQRLVLAEGLRRTLGHEVAEVHDGVDVGEVRHLLVWREVAVGEVLARDEGEHQLVDVALALGRCARPAVRADHRAELEAVVVFVRRLEVVELHAHAVRLVRDRLDRAAADDVTEALVLGHLVAHAVDLVLHAAAGARAARGASRVHSTTPFGVGSPDATPSENGFPANGGAAYARVPSRADDGDRRRERPARLQRRPRSSRLMRWSQSPVMPMTPFLRRCRGPIPKLAPTEAQRTRSSRRTGARWRCRRPARRTGPCSWASTGRRARGACTGLSSRARSGSARGWWPTTGPATAGRTGSRDACVADAAADVAAVADALGVEQLSAPSGGRAAGPHALACAALLEGRCVAAATIAGAAPSDAPDFEFTAGMGEGNVEEFGTALEGREPLAALLRGRRRA